MTKLIDTADINGAHACGRFREDDINSERRLQAWREFGGLTVMRDSGRDAQVFEIEDDDVYAVLNGSTPLGLSPEERTAISDAYWEAVGREQAEERKAIFGRAAA